MEKQQKDKKSMPQMQNWDKPDRNSKRTQNEQDVRGEMAMRGHHSKQQNKKPDNRMNKNS
jgi:hypothetical protein